MKQRPLHPRATLPHPPRSSRTLDFLSRKLCSCPPPSRTGDLYASSFSHRDPVVPHTTAPSPLPGLESCAITSRPTTFCLISGYRSRKNSAVVRGSSESFQIFSSSLGYALQAFFFRRNGLGARPSLERIDLSLSCIDEIPILVIRTRGERRSSDAYRRLANE